MTQSKVNYIYVVDANGKPVMPTSRLGMVRRWLKSGQAIWYGNSRKTIQFVRPITAYVQEMTLGVDAGFHLGMSVVGNNREYYAKVSKGRVSIRRNHYQLRPDDVVFNTKTKKVEIVKGVNSLGKAVVFRTGKTVATSKVVCLHHVNGLKEEKI